jgi:hypothetical protein
MRASIQRYLPILLIFTTGSLPTTGMQTNPAGSESNIFRRPALAEASHELQVRAVLLAKAGQMEIALQLCQEAVKVAPFSAVAQYNLGCLYSKTGNDDESVKRIKLAIELGFRDINLFMNDADLVSLRKLPEYDGLLEGIKQPFEPPKPGRNPFQDGIAWVGPENTVWDESTNLLKTGFEWKRPSRPAPITLEQNELGKRLKRWFAEGTAAGHFGDLYDNCDRDHSNMNYSQFPQLHRIEYRPEIIADVPFGLQNRFLHGGVVLGNSSTSLVNSPFWRSNPRTAYTRPAAMATLVYQFYQNHLYVYPEHADHDPGHNGNGGGYGDVYPANTPYLLISQGSSGSDLPFLHAIAATMAAFRPEVKQRLVENGLLTPTLQKIFRSNYKLVRNPDDYFTGIAHPSVFEGSQIDPLKMAEAAHAMKLDTIPPSIRIKVEQQDQPLVGRDYFDISEREFLFDTPCSIARIGRSLAFRRKMIVSARDSQDLNQRPLKFKWVVLRGDESRISIKPLDENASRSEIIVAWHPRRKTHAESNIESNRVDIGVFADNGASWSAPAFISWTFLDNEERDYDDQGRILSVGYHGGTDEGNYADPLIQTPKTWKDTYHYADDGRITGWTRTQGAGPDFKTEQFTIEGGLVVERDDLGRVAAIRGVQYLPLKVEGKPFPTLVYRPSDEIFRYTYANPEDKIGKITSREKSSP